MIERMLAYPRRILQVRSVSDIYRDDYALYKRLRLDPHATFIGWAGGLPRERRDFLYWSGRQLLPQAAVCDSLTALKEECGELHRHLMGREFMNALIRLEPHLAGVFKIGHQGHRYRSKPELVLGTWFALRKIPVTREFDTGLYRAGSARPLVADFKLLPDGPLIEVLQNDGADRGSRGENYGKRWVDKQKCQTQNSPSTRSEAA